MKIRIKKYTFDLREPHTAGDPLTLGEAQALNALRAENIRNNMAKVVNDATARLDPGEILSTEEIFALIKTIRDYDERYAFVEKHENGRSPRLGHIEAEARLVARARIETRLRASSSVLSQEAIEDMVDLESSHPEVLAEARERVAARQAIAASELEELIGPQSEEL